MKHAQLILWLVACLTTAGCGKHEAPPSDTSTEATQAESPSPVEGVDNSPVPSAAAPANPPPAVAPQPSLTPGINGVVDPNLTAQLRLFVQQNGRLPDSFAEFAGARLDSVPRLSPGLSFAIDPATQEVKIVRGR